MFDVTFIYLFFLFLSLFILFDLSFTPYSRLFHLYGDNQHYGGRKHTTNHRLLKDLSTYGLRESHYELDMKSQSNGSGDKTPGSLQGDSAPTD